MKLREQLIFRILIAASLVFGLFGAILIQLSFDLQLARERNALEQKSARLAQSMEAAAVNYALQNITPSDELLADILLRLDESAALYAGDGLPLTGSAPAAMPGEGICLNGAQLQSLRPLTLAGRTYYLLAASSLSALVENRILLIGAYAVLYLLMIAAFSIVLLLTARKITRPIEHLADVSQRLSGGEMNLRAQAGGSTETDTLAKSFNQMADALTGQIDRQQRFIADLSHEMKTPLTAIIGHADLIRSGRAAGDHAILAAHHILREGQRLNALSARLIDLILLGKDGIEPHPVFAQMLISEATDALTPAAAERGISLDTHCDRALIQGDRTLLAALISNLIDNALKSGTEHIFVCGRLTDCLFTLSVRDDGRGMDAETLSRITEPFYRADKSRSRAQGGAGLGLALCAEIARLHGAELLFESAPGRGTTVSLRISGKEPEDESADQA